MNQLIGTLTAAFSMSLGLVQREGLDVEQFMAIVRPRVRCMHRLFDKKVGTDARSQFFQTPIFLRSICSRI